jgi:predicted RNA binding protein with dsRBD fold (UPF0201 family)
MKIAVTAKVWPTEGKERVLKAVENVFPTLEFKGKDALSAKSSKKDDLLPFKELLKMQQIRFAASGFLMNSIDGDRMKFGLNKQAAFMGKISFVDFDIALGTIEVEITGKNQDELGDLVEWLCEHAGKKGDTEPEDEGWEGA